MPQRAWIQWLAHAVLGATTLFVLFPYAWMLVTSIKPIEDVIAWPLRWIPRAVTPDHYAAILAEIDGLKDEKSAAPQVRSATPAE